MSEYTREEILKMIEEVGGPQNLDLSGKDLSGIDLSSKAITKELEEYRKSNPDQAPPWLSRPPGINLYGAVLKETDLSSAHLAAADLWGADLKGASLRKADLEGACLVDAHLEEADLSEAHLERAYLRGVCLEEANIVEAYLEEANLEWAHLERADLSGAHLEKAHLGQAHLKEAILHGANLKETILTEANLEKASLQWAHLEEATLIAAHLQGADLVGARLRGASLGYARLEGADLCEADLEGARLDGAHLEKVDLSMVESLAAAHFHGAWLDQTRMTKEQLGGAIGEEIRKWYYEANQAYLLLKNNFNQIGRYDDASSAYMKERQMGKMTYHPKIARSYYAKSEGLPESASPKYWAWWRFYVKYILKWAWDWIIEWLCGYGEKPGRVLRAMFLVLVVAPFAYRLFGGLTHADGRVASALDYLVYSFDAFTRIVGTDLVPLTMWGHLVAGLEAFLAILLASLFVYTLGRRMSRS